MLRNERGQAAIFVALMFNVLFVFFAMAINIALVVHDKINLQNAVDLAAYYAASKQAELMNAIAHQNYSIRQSYKLLAWRYRVLGTMGIYRDTEPHPARTGALADTAYPPAATPSLCIVYKPTWDEVYDNENLCNQPNLRIPPLPEVQVIAGFLGINVGIAALSRQLRQQFNQRCEEMAAFNWWFAMSSLYAFRIDQRNRKQVMYALARNMSADPTDFIDLDGNSVLEGARQTFIRNLTFANKQSFENGGGEFKLFNSLGGVNPQQWLVEIKTIPTVVYTDVNANPNDGCNAEPRPVQQLPVRPGSQEKLNQPYPQGLGASSLIPWREERFLADSDYQYSIGVERNPWYMPYVGIQARTTPRQIFFPFGGGITNVARGYAKPFGGRIGPWYQNTWERGAPNSSGTLVDGLMAPRVVAGGLMNETQDPRRLPNYSRFPGDTLGLSSRLSLNGLAGLAGITAKYDFYKNIKEDFGPSNPNDVLAWDGAGQAPVIRSFELAAISPDLFDITYYSIDANFSANYYQRLVANRVPLQIPPDVPIRPDLGHNSNVVPTYSVQEQITQSTPRQQAAAYYFVRDKFHLLTSWLPGEGTYNYDVNASLENFGRCALPDDNLKYKNPGSCVAGGGRVGYSVKLVNRDALVSTQHRIGGPSAAAAGILNPPPETDGW